MKWVKTAAVWISMAFLLSLTACSPKESKEHTVSNQMDGIELTLSIPKQEISLKDDFTAKVVITNHNNSKVKIYASIPADKKDGIAAVMTINQKKYQLLNPIPGKDLPNVKKRTYYDFVLVELEPNETIEQAFTWNKQLFDQVNRKNEAAEKGDYVLSAFVILDDLKQQKESYKPEKQIIAKFDFTVK